MPEEYVCICSDECDCQNPPPDDWDGKDGVWHTSEYCPIHNDNPYPHDDCRAKEHKHASACYCFIYK